jgi:hypothetical protein
MNSFQDSVNAKMPADRMPGTAIGRCGTGKLQQFAPANTRHG